METIVGGSSSSSSGAAMSTEQVLKQAKANLSLLNQLASQAERGAALDFTQASKTLEETRRLLEQHLLLLPSAMGSGRQAASVSGGGLYARQGGPHGVTELQRRRAEQVLAELGILETTLRRHEHKTLQSKQHAAQLQELLGGDGTALAPRRTDYDALDHLEAERRSLQYTRRRVQQMQQESSEVLRALQDQGRRLGGVNEKMSNMLESLGIANTTIVQVLRRNRIDAWIVYGGMAFLLFLLWYIW